MKKVWIYIRIVVFNQINQKKNITSLLWKSHNSQKREKLIRKVAPNIPGMLNTNARQSTEIELRWIGRVAYSIFAILLCGPKINPF